MIVPSTADGLGQALTALLGSEGMRTALARRGREHVASFTSERTARQLIDGYATVLARGGLSER